MQITLNGEDTILKDSISVLQMIEDLELDIRKIAIERNLEIIPFSNLNSTILEDGDRVEIVQFIGGG